MPSRPNCFKFSDTSADAEDRQHSQHQQQQQQEQDPPTTHQLSSRYLPSESRYAHEPSTFDWTASTSAYTKWYPFEDGDTSAAADAARQHRRENAWQITADYYSLVSTSYEQGWGQAFHFSPVTRRGMGVAQAHVAHERTLGALMGLKRGMRVLDVGCGVGGPSRTMARAFGVEVVGITSCEWHVGRGEELNREAGLEGSVSVVLGDFHKMPFEDSSFDAAFDFESICHAVDLDTVHTELARVLKPGGVFACHDWMLTATYDRNTPGHLELRDRIERCNGLAMLHTVDQARASLRRCGFAIEAEENFEARGVAGLPWWYPVKGQWWKAQTWADFVLAWRMCSVHLAWETCVVRLMVLLRRWPKEVLTCMEIMRNCPWSVADGSRQELFTPMQHFLARNMKEEKDRKEEQ